MADWRFGFAVLNDMSLTMACPIKRYANAARGSSQLLLANQLLATKSPLDEHFWLDKQLLLP
jgi:hypothetical protein